MATKYFPTILTLLAVIGQNTYNFIEARFGTNLKNTFYTACTLFLCHSQETETTVILAFAQ